MVISPMPVAPRGPLTRGVSLVMTSMSKAVFMVGNLNVFQSFVTPWIYSSRRRKADALVHAAVELSLEVLGVDDRARVDSSRHLEYFDVPRLRVDFHLGHLDGVDPRFEGRSLARLGIESPFGLGFHGTHIAQGFARLFHTLIRGGARLAHGCLELITAMIREFPATSIMYSCFRVGESASWLWAVDRAGLVLYRLPPQDQLQRKTAAALKALRQDAPDAEAAAADLYAGLFGGVAPRFLGKPRWILSLDKSLFDVPFAALMERASGRPAYLAEHHVIQIAPGAGYWVDAMARRGGGSSSGRFLGVGDPIYNAADSRLPSSSAVRFRWAAWLRPSVGSVTPGTLSLPRLPASASELDSCARAWGGPSTLLEGARAARPELAAALDRSPEIIHFATHFLESAAPQRGRDGTAGGAYGLIALSLTLRGETELLTPVEIAHWRTRAELVVLSGCHSDAGRVLPGAGLLGLTRAWLTAGAHSVAGSRWDTPDESGALFAALYRELRSQPAPDPALALASAQREMIRSGGWRARPRYWGAYFMVGNE